MTAYVNAAINYKNPNNRWNFLGTYYKKSYVVDGVVVDVFNIDTNVADVHGKNTYGYINIKFLKNEFILQIRHE